MSLALGDHADVEAGVPVAALLDGLDGADLRAEVDEPPDVLGRVTPGDTSLAGVDEVRVVEIRAQAIASEDRCYVTE